MARKSLTYLADFACSGLYLERKWSSEGTERRAAESTVGRATSLPPPVQTLHAPDAEHDDSGQVPAAPRILTAIEHKRATNPSVVYPPHVVQQVTELLTPLRRHLGYLSPRRA